MGGAGHMGNYKDREVYGAELRDILSFNTNAFPRTPGRDNYHLRRRPCSLTEAYIRCTRPRTVIRSRDRITGTRPMGATKSFRQIPMGPQPYSHRRQREGQ